MQRIAYRAAMPRARARRRAAAARRSAIAQLLLYGSLGLTIGVRSFSFPKHFPLYTAHGPKLALRGVTSHRWVWQGHRSTLANMHLALGHGPLKHASTRMCTIKVRGALFLHKFNARYLGLRVLLSCSMCPVFEFITRPWSETR
jgi:hypothetical protein